MSDLHVSVAFDDGVVLALSGRLDRTLESIVDNVLDTMAADGALRRRLVIDLRDGPPDDEDATIALDGALRSARRRGFRVDVRPGLTEGRGV